MSDGADLAAETARTSRMRDRGKEGGLFRACMDEIEQDHSIGQKLRGVMLAAGLMTDAQCYAELLGQFYLCTEVLERRLYAAEAAKMALVRQVSALGYHFVEGYEEDLKHLLGDDWKQKTHQQRTEPARRYMARLEEADQDELVAAAFILWGPMVIGGGAMLKPKVKKAFGADATHVFESVVGAGRADRQRAFIAVFDSICLGEHTKIVRAVGEFMKGNNDMMHAVRRSAWWVKYVYAGGIAVVALAGWGVASIWGRSKKPLAQVPSR